MHANNKLYAVHQEEHLKHVHSSAAARLTWYVHCMSRGVTGSSQRSSSSTTGLLREPKSNTPGCTCTADRCSHVSAHTAIGAAKGTAFRLHRAVQQMTVL